MRGARISLWCAVLEALWTRSTSWTGMRCFSCRRSRPCAAFCSGRPRGSAAAAAPTCSGYGMRVSSSPSGVPGAAGWSHDRQRSGYVRDMTPRGFVDAQLRTPITRSRGLALTVGPRFLCLCDIVFIGFLSWEEDVSYSTTATAC